MNVYLIIIATGFVLQVGGMAGYLIETQVERTETEVLKYSTVIDNESGQEIQQTLTMREIMKDWKFVKREK